MPTHDFAEDEMHILEMATRRGGVSLRAICRELRHLSPDACRVMLGLVHGAGLLTPSGKKRRNSRLFLLTEDGRTYLRAGNPSYDSSQP